MKIVIFGGSGFLGSHIADYLSEGNHEVVIYDKRPSPYVQASQEMLVGDILDIESVKKATIGADIVYHFAGVADIDQAKVQPYETIHANIIGTTNILEACRENRIKRFIFASTVYVYSEAGSFYRASKQACELLIESYNKQYDLDFTILRYGSLYGPRADDSNWINRMLRQAVVDKKIVRSGDGNEIREYIHVYDAARLSVKMLENEFKNQYVMITGYQPIRIKDFLIMVKEMLNNDVVLTFNDASDDEHYEITPYNFKPKMAKRVIGSDYVDLGQGIFELLNSSYEPKAVRAK